jgi:hypothetical protein
MLLAKQATNEESKRTFTNLARSWTTLAEALEQAHSLLHALSEIEVLEALTEIAPPSRPEPVGHDVSRQATLEERCGRPAGLD